MSDSNKISSVIMDSDSLQGLEPISFDLNLTSVINQKQQTYLVNEEIIRSKYILNGNTLVFDISTVSSIVRDLNTIPQFVHIKQSVLDESWNSKYEDKLYKRSIDTKVSIIVASVIVFLTLLYHFIHWIKRLRLPK
eukprot:NODE_44_length_28780_cov_0.148496.p13 type:complete len:136 gc:universal NODE_44_length_28780_cov_0.148496:26109-26516(+)